MKSSASGRRLRFTTRFQFTTQLKFTTRFQFTTQLEFTTRCGASAWLGFRGWQRVPTTKQF